MRKPGQSSDSRKSITVDKINFVVAPGGKIEAVVVDTITLTARPGTAEEKLDEPTKNDLILAAAAVMLDLPLPFGLWPDDGLERRSGHPYFGVPLYHV